MVTRPSAATTRDRSRRPRAATVPQRARPVGNNRGRRRIPQPPTGDAMSTETTPAAGTNGTSSAAESLSVTDNRTGRRYEIPIVDGAIRSLDLRQIRTSDEDFGLLAYDPAFMNTAS